MTSFYDEGDDDANRSHSEEEDDGETNRFKLVVMKDLSHVNGGVVSMNKGFWIAQYDGKKPVDPAFVESIERQKPPAATEPEALEAIQFAKERAERVAQEPTFGAGSTYGGSEAKKRQLLREQRMANWKEDKKQPLVMKERSKTSRREFKGFDTAVDAHTFILLKENNTFKIFPLEAWRKFQPQYIPIGTVVQSDGDKGNDGPDTSAASKFMQKMFASAHKADDSPQTPKRVTRDDDELARDRKISKIRAKKERMHEGKDTKMEELDCDLAISDDDGEDGEDEYKELYVKDSMEDSLVYKSVDGKADGEDDLDVANKEEMEKLLDAADDPNQPLMKPLEKPEEDDDDIDEEDDDPLLDVLKKRELAASAASAAVAKTISPAAESKKRKEEATAPAAKKAKTTPGPLLTEEVVLSALITVHGREFDFKALKQVLHHKGYSLTDPAENQAKLKEYSLLFMDIVEKNGKKCFMVKPNYLGKR